jgi:hypothetical protein
VNGSDQGAMLEHYFLWPIFVGKESNEWPSELGLVVCQLHRLPSASAAYRQTPSRRFQLILFTAGRVFLLYQINLKAFSTKYLLLSSFFAAKIRQFFFRGFVIVRHNELTSFCNRPRQNEQIFNDINEQVASSKVSLVKGPTTAISAIATLPVTRPPCPTTTPTDTF